MHELSVCASIADIVRRRAPDRRVRTIHLRVGQLRQIVPDTLSYCWTVATADTSLDGSVLEIVAVPARIACRDCGSTADVGDIPLFLCHACASYNVAVTGGEELELIGLDVTEE